MSRKARYILCEGVDGSGKSTQVKKLVEHLRSKGYSVLDTKEPGTPHSPLTMKLRGIMLDAQYESEMTVAARELVSQAIRSIHLEKVIAPALQEYDFIIQDRGILSGFAYAQACGVSFQDIDELGGFMIRYTNYDHGESTKGLYDNVIFLSGDPEKLLARARGAKQEFAAGDAIEAKGASFAKQVAQNFNELLGQRNSIVRIDVEDKTPDEVFQEMLEKLNLGK